MDSLTVDTLTVNLSNFPETYYVPLADSVKVSTKEVSTLFGMGIDWGAVVIPTVATIVVFVIGILIERLQEKHKRIKQTIDFRTLLFEWIELSAVPIKRQIDLIRKLSSDIKDNKTIQQVQFVFSKSMTGKLGVVNAENVVKYLVLNSSKTKNGKSEMYAYNIVSLFDYLNSFEAEVDKQYDAYQKQSMKLFNEWNGAIVELNKAITTIPDSIAALTKYDEFKKKYDDYCKNYQDVDGSVDVDYVKKHLLEPIIDLAGEGYVFGVPELSYVDRIVLLARELLFVTYKWDKLKEGFANVFDNITMSVNASVEGLLNAKEYFKNNTKAIQ